MSYLFDRWNPKPVEVITPKVEPVTVEQFSEHGQGLGDKPKKKSRKAKETSQKPTK